ncbi:NnrU family protein [uncultured Rhodoblastus sp.]|uniref:NnrU family protein n=1 Tax=uncultured Rhodoblastus sp. TaxID=543037 RepID=UPI0025E380F5|nr:NnrU family protein [uncultured Rhodoblastus sp.]
MAILVLGLVLFIGAHSTPTFPDFRTGLIERLGPGPYKLLFTAASLAGLVLIVVGASALRGSAEDLAIWSPPLWTRHLALALMLPAFVLIAAANIPSHIRDKARHPMLAGVKIWAFAHLLANGDLLALLLFGSFLAYAIYDRISLKRRAAEPKSPARGWGGDAAAALIGTALWAVTLFWLHPLAGVPVLPSAV